MRILITNDDGVGAGQLVPLIRFCRTLGEVTAVVPKHEQSGKSQGIELHKPFEAKEVALTPDVTVWAVDSTPADCVRFAMLSLGGQFDLVISGINRGLNVGVDMLYSGTVGAASEAVNLGVKAISISTAPEDYDCATAHLDRVFAFIREHALLEKCDFYNINLPREPRGIRITRQGGPYYSDNFPAIGENLYRPTGFVLWKDSGDDTLDTDATLHGWITVTPLTIDKTNRAVYESLLHLNG